MYTVYMHKTPSQKVYIGITNQKLYKRWKNGKGYSDNEHFYNAILKYGWKNIEHIIIYDGLTEDEAKNAEVYLIAKYNANDPKFGYNKTPGGNCGFIGHHSEQTKAILKQKCSGWKHSAEARAKISEAGKGHTVTEEQRKRISESNKGKHKMSEELREKLKKSHEGLTPWNKGKKLTEEHKEKLRGPRNLSAEVRQKLSDAGKGRKPPNSRKVICIENGEIYQSATDAAKAIGANQTSLSEACRRAIRCKGLHWKYLEEGETHEK